MGRDADAATLTVVTQSVILADDLVALYVSKTQRNAAVVANIASGRHRAVRKAVDYDTLVEQPCGKRLIGYFVGVGYRIPERSERAPVGLGEGALPRQSGGSRQVGSQKFRGRNEGCGGRHESLWAQAYLRINLQKV
jgi:hypothetical protein